MSLNARFGADFTQFEKAIEGAKSHLFSFEKGAATAARDLSRLTDSFSGQRIIADALRSAEAVERIGGASKLTAAEQARLNALVSEALDKYRALGETAPDHLRRLETATRAVETPLDKAKTMLGGFAPILGPLGGAIAGAFSVHSVLNFADGIAQTSDELHAMKVRTGVGVETLQALRIVADDSAVSLDSVAMAAANLNRNIATGDASTVSAFKELGLSWQAVRDMSPEERLYAVGRALGAVTDSGKQSALAMQLMEKAGTESLPVFVNNLEAAAEAMKNSGRILSEEGLKAAKDFDEWWDRMIDTAKARAVDFAAAMNRGVSNANIVAPELAVPVPLGPSSVNTTEQFRMPGGGQPFGLSSGSFPVEALMWGRLNPPMTPEGIVGPQLDSRRLGADTIFGPGTFIQSQNVAGMVRAAEIEDEQKRLDEFNQEVLKVQASLLQVQETTAAVADRHEQDLNRMGGAWRRLGLEAAASIKLMVPEGFSFEKAYRDAGLFVHNAVSGLAGPQGKRPTGSNFSGVTVHVDARDAFLDTPAGQQRMFQKLGSAAVTKLRSQGVSVG